VVLIHNIGELFINFILLVDS